MSESNLWVDKHKPETFKDIIGQDQALKEVMDFVKAWKPGKSMLLAGSPGTGKTLAIEILAREKNYQLLQLNASDARNPELIEKILGEGSKNMPLFHSGKFILIDEVDGISARDRGAAGAIIKIIKESRFPVFLIANNQWSPKLRSLRSYCKPVKFKNIHMYDIMKKLKGIAGLEDIELKGNVARMLGKWSHGDLRSAITDLQMVSEGKKSVEEKDLDILGYRERKSPIFSTLPTIFHSKNIKVSRKAIWESDKDPDEVFLWIETNLVQELQTPGGISKGFDLLSKADLFRNRVRKQQNWRFKAYMCDLMAGISLFRPEIKREGFIPYKPPDRMIELGKTKNKRALIKALCKKLGPELHCSSSVARKDYLPYLKIILKKRGSDMGMELDNEDLALIKAK
jgi:replication factor C large subunit